MTQKDKKLIIAELFNRCWDDESYKATFIENPAKILAEVGITVDAGKTYRVVENTADVKYIVLPEKDAAAVFEQFKKLAAQKENFVSADKEIRFVQNSDAAQYIILPQKPGESLTDEELDAVAGGENIIVATSPVDLVSPYANVGVVAVQVNTIGAIIAVM